MLHSLISQFVHPKLFRFENAFFSSPPQHIPGSFLCPVAALVNHVQIDQVHQDMPLFSVRSANSVSPITYAHFRVIKSVCLDSTCYSPRSFRRGSATFAFEAHVPSELIKAQGDWHSDCYFIYLEMSDRQKRAAATRKATGISQIAI